jgi:ATP-dependent DNA helicase RecG
MKSFFLLKIQQDFIPQSRIELTVYIKQKVVMFLNDRIFEGNIFRNIATILEFHCYFKKDDSDGNIRTEKQIILFCNERRNSNAIVHRDYNSVNGFMQIAIFNDRTEISNYGGLPNGITIKDLEKEHNSVLRKP